MIQAQVKLRLNKIQEALLAEWLFMLTGVWNWAIRKIENDAMDGIYYTPMEFQNLLADHGKKMGIPSHTLQGMLAMAHTAWKRCYQKIGGKPKLKGMRNRLNSIPFPDPIHTPEQNHVKLPGIGTLRFHQQDLPEGKIKCGRIVKRASGWYLCLFVNAERSPIQAKDYDVVGIDPGFSHLITLSSGEKVDHPKELQQSIKRLGQAQRGGNRKLTARLHERIQNQRKDRNHKLSLRLVKENEVIAVSKDNIKGMASMFGKSVASSAHAQLRQMLSYKTNSRAGGAKYVEVASHHSTRTCSSCGCLTGPTGLAGLSVREWACTACGTLHDRDVNAAINTLIAGVGTTHEWGYRNAA
jgi:putative transposase